MNRLDMTGTGTADQTPVWSRERGFVFLLIPSRLVAVQNLRLLESWPHSDSQSKYANKSVQICLQSALANEVGQMGFPICSSISKQNCR